MQEAVHAVRLLPGVLRQDDQGGGQTIALVRKVQGNIVYVYYTYRSGGRGDPLVSVYCGREDDPRIQQAIAAARRKHREHRLDVLRAKFS